MGHGAGEQLPEDGRRVLGAGSRRVDAHGSTDLSRIKGSRR